MTPPTSKTCQKCKLFDIWIKELEQPLSDGLRHLLRNVLIDLKAQHKEGTASISH